MVLSMHPSLRILSLIVLAIMLQFLEQYALAAIAIGVLLTASIFYTKLLRKMLKRSRWLLLTLMLIFSFTTPGEYLPWWTMQIAPTYEGLESGLLQSIRLIVMLAGLAILLGSTQREQLMAGIFQLLMPLRCLGIGSERFTARLWLTMHYVEEDSPKKSGSLWEALDGLAVTNHTTADVPVHFSLPAMNRLDWGLVAVACLVALWWYA